LLYSKKGTIYDFFSSSSLRAKSLILRGNLFAILEEISSSLARNDDNFFREIPKQVRNDRAGGGMIKLMFGITDLVTRCRSVTY